MCFYALFVSAGNFFQLNFCFIFKCGFMPWCLSAGVVFILSFYLFFFFSLSSLTVWKLFLLPCSLSAGEQRQEIRLRRKRMVSSFLSSSSSPSSTNFLQHLYPPLRPLSEWGQLTSPGYDWFIKLLRALLETVLSLLGFVHFYVLVKIFIVS